MSDFTHLRQHYNKAELRRKQLEASPFRQFTQWMQLALEANIPEPYAMTLATANAAGRVSARIVLLRKQTTEGFEFYTNYQSPKARDLAENPQAELMFFWPTLEQQVRIFGAVEQISEQASCDYFNVRPVISQISAHASTPQTGVIESRQALDAKYQRLEEAYAGKAVPKPDFWGGYILKPTEFEFWQGRPNRRHDRFRYQKQGDTWAIDRLMP